MHLRRVAALVSVVAVFSGCPQSPTCTAGTVLKDGACVPELVCGAGTMAQGNTCVPNVTCAAGTTASGGLCVPDVTCGAGTSAVDGGCVPDVKCGVGTTAMNGACVPDSQCAAGTVSMNGQCVPEVVCGAGTTAVNGRCEPNVTCGAGTRPLGARCVPDGTIICTQGTRFDLDAGVCVVDPTACAAGTTLVGTRCVTDGSLLMGLADRLEDADAGTLPDGGLAPAGSFDAPVDGGSTTFYGCITPDGTRSDDDTWLLTTSGPTVLELTADGLNGLAAGFVVTPADPAVQALPGFGRWNRIGINLSGDTSKREVFFPLAGTWAVKVLDSRELLSGQAAGGPDTCYFATVRHVALAAPTPLTPGALALTDDGHVKQFVFTASALGGDVAQASALAGNTAALATSLVVTRGPTVKAVRPAGGASLSADALFGGLAPSEVVTVTFDAEFDLSLAPEPFTLTTSVATIGALPTAGGVVTVTQAGPITSLIDLGLHAFDVAAPSVVHFDVVASTPVDMVLLRGGAVRDDGTPDVLAVIDGFGGAGRAAFQGEFVHFVTPGRYYLATSTPGMSTYTLTSTLTTVTPAPLTLATAAPGALGIGSNAFHTLDLTDPVWLEFGVQGTINWGPGTVLLDHYDLSQDGWLRLGVGTTANGNVFPAFSSTQPAVAPFVPAPRILATDLRDWLVRVRASLTPPGPGPTYSLLAQNRPDVTNVGMLTVGTPVVRTLTTVTNGAPARVIAFAPQGATVRLRAHPTQATANLRIVRLSVSEGSLAVVDAAPVGGDETMASTVATPPNEWVAYAIENLTAGVPTQVDLTFTSSMPRPYVVSTGTLPFVDACDGGVVLGTNLDDQLFTQTTPFPFALFGEGMVATFRVATNGWLSWDTGTVSFGGYQNRRIPLSGAPDGVVAPFWQDLDRTTLCRQDDLDAGVVTVQWTGNLYQLPTLVQYQARLRSTGVIDFIYGPNHAATGATPDSDGNGATVGVESLSGMVGHELVFNDAGVAPNTSFTLTPAP